MEIEVKRYEGLDYNIYWNLNGCECWYNDESEKWGIELNSVDPLVVEKTLEMVTSNIKSIISLINQSFRRHFTIAKWDRDFEYYEPRTKVNKLVVIYVLV